MSLRVQKGIRCGANCSSVSGLPGGYFTAAGSIVAVGERTDAILIFLIVVVNAILGLIQRSRAERALNAQANGTPHAVVTRAVKPWTFRRGAGSRRVVLLEAERLFRLT